MIPKYLHHCFKSYNRSSPHTIGTAELPESDGGLQNSEDWPRQGHDGEVHKGRIIYSACGPFGVSPRVEVHLDERFRHVVTDGWLQGGLAIYLRSWYSTPKPNCMPSYQLMSLQRLTETFWLTTDKRQNYQLLYPPPNYLLCSFPLVQS